MFANRKPICVAAIAGLLAVQLAPVAAQEEPGQCVELGALAYDNWTKADAGGTGAAPGGVQNLDYVRCKSCHGWDRRGLEGGYARRERLQTQPNAGAGDSDTRSRAIETGTVTAEQVRHAGGDAGTGRSYADGTGSWVALAAQPAASNTAAHAAGYTLGNQHPDFSSGGPNGGFGVPGSLQVDCIVDFLNFEDGDPSRYFAAINAGTNPALYTIVDTADADAGQAFWNQSCDQCHNLQTAVDYVKGDGKFSELAHKARWGIPDTSMDRQAMGDPTSADIANLMLFLQQQSGTGIVLNPGLTGTWWNDSRDGEGFLLEFGYLPGTTELTLFASFYTYDNMGNQAWLVAQPTGPLPASGGEVPVNVYQATGPMWGDDFDFEDRNLLLWGSGTFTFTGCENAEVTLVPGTEAQSMGYTELGYPLTRLLEPGNECPAGLK